MSSLSSIFTTLKSLCDGQESVSIKEIKERFETRGFGPLLLLPALITLLPIGGIPGVPSLCGIIVIFVSAQMACGKSHPWLPSRIESHSIPCSSLKNAIDKVMPYTKKLDDWSESRMVYFVHENTLRILAFLCIIHGFLCIILEIVPLATAIPATALLCIGLGATLRDGLFVAVGIFVSLMCFVSSYLLLIEAWQQL